MTGRQLDTSTIRIWGVSVVTSQGSVLFSSQRTMTFCELVMSNIIMRKICAMIISMNRLALTLAMILVLLWGNICCRCMIGVLICRKLMVAWFIFRCVFISVLSLRVTNLLVGGISFLVCKMVCVVW